MQGHDHATTSYSEAAASLGTTGLAGRTSLANSGDEPAENLRQAVRDGSVSDVGASDEAASTSTSATPGSAPRERRRVEYSVSVAEADRNPAGTYGDGGSDGIDGGPRSEYRWPW